MKADIRSAITLTTRFGRWREPRTAFGLIYRQRFFLTAPEDYDGGELIIEDTCGVHSIKLPAGDLILYPAFSRMAYEIEKGF